MSSSGPITHNGIHPISKVRAISAPAVKVEAKPAVAVVTAKPAVAAASAPAATKETGLGSKFYPKQLGLRGK